MSWSWEDRFFAFVFGACALPLVLGFAIVYGAVDSVDPAHAVEAGFIAMGVIGAFEALVGFVIWRLDKL